MKFISKHSTIFEFTTLITRGIMSGLRFFITIEIDVSFIVTVSSVTLPHWSRLRDAQALSIVLESYRFIYTHSEVHLGSSRSFAVRNTTGVIFGFDYDTRARLLHSLGGPQ